MFYSKSTGGFYDRDINTLIPADAVEISRTAHAALLAGQAEGKKIVSGPDGEPVLADPEPFIAADVEVVTMRQARLALFEAGKLDMIAPAIEQLPEPERTKVRIEWEYAQEIRKDWPALQSLAQAIGLDAAALTEMFNYAATL